MKNLCCQREFTFELNLTQEQNIRSNEQINFNNERNSAYQPKKHR